MNKQLPKRARRACVGCRRKKSKCPGEKPGCSSCLRLGQKCIYSFPPDRTASTSPEDASIAQQRTEVSFQPRKTVKRTYEEISQNGSVLTLSSLIARTPRTAASPQDLNRQTHAPLFETWDDLLPPDKVMEEVLSVYFQFCHSQPLALFSPQRSSQRVQEWSDVLLLTIAAVAVRYSNHPFFTNKKTLAIDHYAKAAQDQISEIAAAKKFELSTLQALCLLSFVDYTSGRTQSAWLNISFVTHLARSAGLDTSILQVPEQESPEQEERRLCFWSIVILNRTCSSGSCITPSLPFQSDYSKRVPLGPLSHVAVNSSSISQKNLAEDEIKDLGIYVYAMRLINLWGKVVEYIMRPASLTTIPPWSSASEYTSLRSEILDYELTCPDDYRYVNMNFLSRSAEELNKNRNYWQAWIVNQILYPTILTVLDHPVLCSTRFRPYFGRMPGTWLESSLQSAVVNPQYILRTISEAKERSFPITDPFVGHCVSIAATVFIYHSQSSDKALASEARESASTLTAFLQEMGEYWPNVKHITEKLSQMAQKASVALEPPTASKRTYRAFNADASEIWQILDYASISTLPTSEGIFGGSLAEMSTAQKAASESMCGSRPTTRDGESGAVDASALDLEDELNLDVEWDSIVNDPWFIDMMGYVA